MGLYIGKMDRKWLSRVLIIMLADILGILGSYLLALWARFDLHFMDIPPEFLQGYLSTIWWWVLICLAVFWLCNLYNSIWRFVSVDALMRIILAYVILGGLSFGCVKLFHIVMPRSYYVWGLLCSFFITAGIRFFYRGVRYLRNRVPGSQKGTENVMIIGAGQAGRQLIREYAVSSHLNSRVACLIDDNPAKRGRILEGVRIVGGRRDIPQAVKRYDIRKIIFAIPSLQGAGRQEILNICSKTGCQIQVVPGIYQLVKGEVTISKLRRVELQDLLGRDPIRVNLGEICGYINDKTVLITGGGGSIGSELCRQIARHKPRRLVIFAAEDVGNADPRALQLATSAMQAVEMIGLPEANLILSQATLYCATAPKSNSATTAIIAAQADVEKDRVQPVPLHLRDSHYAGAREMGNGVGYQYPHDHEGGFVVQDYLSVEKRYYEPKNSGYESKIKERVEYWRSLREYGKDDGADR